MMRRLVLVLMMAWGAAASDVHAQSLELRTFVTAVKDQALAAGMTLIEDGWIEQRAGGAIGMDTQNYYSGNRYILVMVVEGCAMSCPLAVRWNDGNDVVVLDDDVQQSNEDGMVLGRFVLDQTENAVGNLQVFVRDASGVALYVLLFAMPL